MWHRRKRMELVRPADRRKQRYDDRSPDEVYLTRRMFLFKGLVLGGFAALAGKLWKMQVMESGVYAGRAQANQFRAEPISAPRGMILDRNGEVLAENRTSWTVSITPAQLPRDDEQRGSLREQVIQALDLKEMLVVRTNGLPLGSEEDVLASLADAIGEERSALQHYVLDESGDNIVPVLEDLEPDEAASFSDLEKQLPGVSVINHFDYVVQSDPGSPLPVVLKEDIDRDVALSLESNQAYLPGVVVGDEKLVRRYPTSTDFSHIIGYVGPITEEEYEATRNVSGQSPYLRTDYVGRGGLEEALEEELRGRRGAKWLETDARGVTISELQDRRVEPRAGSNVILTLDRAFQQAVTVALQEGIDAANAAAQEEGREEVGSGAAIAMDPRNGEILALVSLPTFDNQLFVDGISQSQFEEYMDNPFHPLTNFAVSGAFPPGSTVKPLLGCIALQEGTIDTGTQYVCKGEIRVPTFGGEEAENTYVCWYRPGHGALAIEAAIAESCNIFFYNVGAPGQTPQGADEPLHYFNPGDPEPHYFEGLGIDRIEEYLKQEFGFGTPTGIELANEASGVVPNPQWLFQSALREYWSVGDTINVSIGQGHLSCSPLQLTCAISAIANGGTLIRPHLVHGYQHADSVEEVSPEIVRELAIDPGHVNTVRSGMRRTVTDGTARGKFIRTGEGILIAGKTGTADYGEAVDGSYKKQHAWFCGFAPYDDPEIVVTVLLAGGGEGSTFAVPVADAILAMYFGKESPATSNLFPNP